MGQVFTFGMDIGIGAFPCQALAEPFPSQYSILGDLSGLFAKHPLARNQAGTIQVATMASANDSKSTKGKVSHGVLVARDRRVVTHPGWALAHGDSD